VNKKRFSIFLHALLLAILPFCLSGCADSETQPDAKPPLLDSLSANGNHTCGLDITGKVYCWGSNKFGELGIGSNQENKRPILVKNLSIGNRYISTGYEHNCVLTASGGVRCWGHNQAGQLGDGTQADSNLPVEVIHDSGIARGLSTGIEHSCILNSLGGVECWGANTFGQLGVEGYEFSKNPIGVTNLGSGTTQISSGWYHTCALTVAGGVKCWGSNKSGQLGNGTFSDSRIPVDVIDLNFGVRAISAAAEHTCAITAVGAVKCWGSNQSGELGNGNNENSNSPQDVIGLAAGIRAIAVGGEPTKGSHSCAVTVSGGVVCWGSNENGQLGNGNTTDSNIPLDVQGLPFGMRGVATGGRHSCALTTTGGIYCWGDNQFGQLGNGSTQGSSKPIELK